MAKTRTSTGSGNNSNTRKSSSGKVNGKSGTAQNAGTSIAGAKTANGNGVNGDCGNGKLRCKSLIIDGTKYRTRLNQKFENRQAWENPNPKRIFSAIPGTIIKIAVKAGQEVEAGDQMLTLEAMKMKNRIHFQTAGTVKKIHVKEGEKVPKDFLMLEMK